MRSTKASAESGNATIEFVAFALLIFAPLASFAAESSVALLAKQQVTSAAAQLARAYSLDPKAFELLVGELRAEYPKLEVEASRTGCCVLVVAKLGEAVATAKQIA
jgi:hypothetical protein